MTAAKTVLVIGGGFSGMTAAILLARGGVQVDLVEIGPDWRSYGAGISLHGAALRVFQSLDLLQAFQTIGAVTDGLVIRHPAHDGELARLPTPPADGVDLAGNAAVMRPALAAMLSGATRAAGVAVRLGQSAKVLGQDDLGVSVAFSDGSNGSYDLVIGADGLHSQTRKALLPDAPAPQYIGQAVWRAELATPPGITTLNMWMGPGVKAGINPVSASASYIFLTEDAPHRQRFADAELPDRMAALLRGFGSPVLRAVADGLGPDSRVIHRPLDRLLVAQPWHRGRVTLIGDAVHATTPHLGAGACIGMEDGITLAEAILGQDDLEQALRQHEARRWERTRMVVENSSKLAEIELTGGDRDLHRSLMASAIQALCKPI